MQLCADHTQRNQLWTDCETKRLIIVLCLNIVLLLLPSF